MGQTDDGGRMDRERVALVTGAGRGIGSAVARRLAADGMSVAVADVDPTLSSRTAHEIVRDGGKAHPVTLDVTDPDQVRVAVRDICAALGEPTVLVNNAGIVRDNLMAKCRRRTGTTWST
jgi:3-oxoacyl-[acyl-carrier protein] reductase